MSKCKEKEKKLFSIIVKADSLYKIPKSNVTIFRVPFKGKNGNSCDWNDMFIKLAVMLEPKTNRLVSRKNKDNLYESMSIKDMSIFLNKSTREISSFISKLRSKEVIGTFTPGNLRGNNKVSYFINPTYAINNEGIYESFFDLFGLNSQFCYNSSELDEKLMKIFDNNGGKNG